MAPMLVLLAEQVFLPVAVLPTLAAFIIAAGAQHRLARAKNRDLARFFARFSPVEHRWAMVLRFIDTEGRKRETRFLPTRSMELTIDDPIFTNGWIGHRDRLSIWGLTNIRTGVHRTSRALAVWPIVLTSVAIMALTAAAVL
ncbi:hypothetical protein GPX89_25610 [Nocardia sp. ET3-3]|uniref:Uncharacterized protein n=1 Tax=Nocardia terrae TaxID=2675851 RepID=A0A7K1V1W8_9NOCA|nr:hypothetical protein [Nocardia terrae]